MTAPPAPTDRPDPLPDERGRIEIDGALADDAVEGIALIPQTPPVPMDHGFDEVGVAEPAPGAPNLDWMALSATAATVTFAPAGELLGTTVQDALVGLDARLSVEGAIARSSSMVTIEEQWTDLPDLISPGSGSGSGSRHGTHRWTALVTGEGAGVTDVTAGPSGPVGLRGGGRFLTTGTSVDGRAALVLAPQQFDAGPTPFLAEWMVTVPVPAEPAEDFRAIVGFTAPGSDEPDRGVWFECGGSGTSWRFATSRRDQIDTGVDVVPLRPYRLRIVGDGGGNVFGFVDGVQRAHSPGTNPGTAHPAVAVRKLTGTAPRLLAFHRFSAYVEVFPGLTGW